MSLAVTYSRGCEGSVAGNATATDCGWLLVWNVCWIVCADWTICSEPIVEGLAVDGGEISPGVTTKLPTERNRTPVASRVNINTVGLRWVMGSTTNVY